MQLRGQLTRLICYVFYFTGISALWHFLNVKLGRIPIITYHSIETGNPGGGIKSCLELLGMVVHREIFAEQIKYLSKSYKVIGLEDLMEFIGKGKKPPAGSLVITFDDGFKNNYTLAAPILKKYDFPAVFFIIGDTLSPREVVWNHFLYKIIDRTDAEKINLEGEDFLKPQDAEKEGRWKIEISREIKNKLLLLSREEKKAFLQRLCQDQGLNMEELVNDNDYLNPTELRDLLKEGHRIGAHSMAHEPLADMPPGLKDKEIRESKNKIQEITGKSFLPFAYPFGDRKSFNKVDKEMLKAAKLDCAVTTVEGLNGVTADVYELKRIEIGNFGKIEFSVHLSGIMGDLKWLAKKMIKRGKQ